MERLNNTNSPKPDVTPNLDGLCSGQIMAICVLCRVPIIGPHLISPLGETICGGHPGATGCRWCGRFSTAKGSSCGPCASSAVRTNGELQALAEPVLIWLTQQIGAHRLDQATLGLSDAKALRGTQYAETRWVQDHAGFRAAIDVVTGIPESNAKEALAHEYGHLLLAADPFTLTYIGPHGLSGEEEEGFCEVIRALWIDHEAGPQRHERRVLLETNAVDVYRNGFAQMWPRYTAAGSISRFREGVLFKIGASANPITTDVIRPRRRIPVVGATRDVGPRVPLEARGRSHRPVIATRTTRRNGLNGD